MEGIFLHQEEIEDDHWVEKVGTERQTTQRNPEPPW